MWYRTVRILRWITAAITGYETFAIIYENERFPTLSTLCGKHRWLAPGLMLALFAHLAWPIGHTIRQKGQNTLVG